MFDDIKNDVQKILSEGLKKFDYSDFNGDKIIDLSQCVNLEEVNVVNNPFVLPNTKKVKVVVNGSEGDEFSEGVLYKLT